MDTRMITALYERLSRDDDVEGESNPVSYTHLTLPTKA